MIKYVQGVWTLRQRFIFPCCANSQRFSVELSTFPVTLLAGIMAWRGNWGLGSYNNNNN